MNRSPNRSVGSQFSNGFSAGVCQFKQMRFQDVFVVDMKIDISIILSAFTSVIIYSYCLFRDAEAVSPKDGLCILYFTLISHMMST